MEMEMEMEGGGGCLKRASKKRQHLTQFLFNLTLIHRRRLIRTFGRRMATDKFIQCFACINVLLLTGVIIYAIVSKKGLGGDTNATPQSPVRMLFESMLGKEFE